MKKLAYIDVVFENQEFIHIPVEKIIRAQINQVKQKIIGIQNEETYEFKFTESLELVIDKTFVSNEGMYNYIYKRKMVHPIARLMQYNDVVGIIIILDDQSEYMINCGTFDDYLNNIYQTTSYSDEWDGVLKIKNPEIEVNSSEIIDLKKDTDKFLSLYKNL